jgi:hypothetical protein
MFKMSLTLLKYMYIRCLCYMFQPHSAIFRQHIFGRSLLHCALGQIVFIKTRRLLLLLISLNFDVVG